MIYLKALGIWLIILVSAIISGTFRTKVLLPSFGEQTAHQVGTIIFLIIQSAIIFLFIKKINLKENQLLLKIGLFWVVLTIIFEFVFGHYVMGHSFKKLFADYNIFNGRLWVLVLMNNIVAPVISGKIIR
ncbi:MAG: hypothetical protein ACHQLA_03955 [Ignavibacteriales bacterium]